MFTFCLLLFSIFFHTIQSVPIVPIGLMFYGHDQQLYTRVNPYAREYILEKFAQRSSSYNITELIDAFDFDNADVLTWTNICQQLSRGIISIIGYINAEDLDWLPSFCSTYQIPLLYLNNIYENNHFSLSLMPDIIPALVAIIRHYQINRLVYIYDDINGAARLKQLLKLQTLNTIQNLNIISRYLDYPEDSYELLHNIELITNTPTRTLTSNNIDQKIPGRYIVLDFHSFHTYRIMMDKIKHYGMTTSDYHYILLTFNAKQLDMTYFRYGGVNVTFFDLRKSNENNDKYMNFLQREKLYSFEALLLADAWEIFIRTIDRIFNTNHEFKDNFRLMSSKQSIDTCQNQSIQSWLLGKIYFDYLLNVTFQGLTGHIQFSNLTSQRINYTFDIYRITRNNEPKQIGIFQPPNILELADDSFYRLRTSFDNRTRLIVTIFDAPFMMLKKTRNSTLTENDILPGTILDTSELEGFCVDLAYAICHERLKIPYKFLIETKYGKEIEKGVWDGMVGALVRREADLSIASLTINGAREKAIDFSKPFIDLGISIMIHTPEKQKPGVFSFMDPLSRDIWICVILSYVLVSAILYLVSRFSSYEWYFEKETDIKPQNKFSMRNSFFFSFAAFMHQSVDLLPRSMSGRVVTGVWWFFSLILVSSYTANLAAFLTVEKLVTPIETVEDLAQQTDIRYGTLKGGSTMAFFNKSTITTFKRMWNFMQQHKDDVFVSSNREGIEKVRRSKGKFAFLLESTMNEYESERSPCNTMRVGDNIDAKGYGIGTPLGSDLREAINIAVLELTENGFLASLKQKWYYEGSECTNAGSKDSKIGTPLNLANVAGMFYVLIIGLGSAMVIAFLEFLFKAKIDSHRLNQNIWDIMRRNLRISITGIDFDEKSHQQDYLRLQQQQIIRPLLFQTNSQRSERASTITSTTPDIPKTSGYDLLHRGQKNEYDSCV